MLDSELQYLYCQVATVVSIVCSAALVTTWCAVPRWRSLHNYISVHQITTGSLHLSLHFIIMRNTTTKWAEKLGECLLFLSLCWSLCGQLLAYARLVLLLPDTSDVEDRRRALRLSYGTLLVVKCITDGVVPHIFYLGDYFTVRLCHQGPRVLSETIVITLNVLLYVNIARALLSRRCEAGVRITAGLRARGRRLAGLIGVTILSDVLAGLYLSADFLVLHIISNRSECAFEVYKILKMIAATRLVVQTVVILFNVRSRAEFARYFQLRRNRRVNRL